ncbi:MAG: DUF2065 family protein [Nitrosomonadales bacterium]|nr:DUF2065 family protein [Nitrosomonadales bacterium]MBT3918082.1 DUF2065 family protein [Nitrosomonadales bacterium]MBT4183453.1 DUF2065 family protein [Nitrosomonadales bacterium]MBT4570689.1 DUF2065 family protein [Nitrosomonadales bacterium]MBT4759458.1 DUF2065 family protein [Nitrosomonadales bacterium]
MRDSIVLALGLVLVVEGLFPLFFTQLWKDAFIKITNQKNGQIKFYGLLSVIIGIMIIFIGTY